MDVNQKELAAILGVTDRRIRQLRNDYGLFEKSKSKGNKYKNYCLEKCVPEYINYKLEAEVQGGTSYDRDKEVAEHEQIKKKISMLKLRKLRKELHEAEDVEIFLTDMLMNFKNRLLSIPPKVAPLVVAEDDVNIILGTMEKEIFEALDELAEYDPMKIDQENRILDLDEDEDEDDEGEE